MSNKNNKQNKDKINALIQKRLSKARSNYSDTIDYYASLRQSFINDLNQAWDLKPNEVYFALEESLINGSKNTKEVAIDRTVELYGSIANQLKNISEEDVNNLQRAYNEIEDKRDKAEILGNEKFKEAMNNATLNILSQDKMAALIREFLEKEKNFSNNFQTYNIGQFIWKAEQLKSNILYDLARGKSSKTDTFTVNDIYIDKTSFFVKTAAGFYNEAATYDALMQLTKHVKDNCKIEVFDIGGQNTHIDELVRINYPSKTFNGTVNIVNDYGIQAKSWLVPWDKNFDKKSKDSLYLSHNASLLNTINSNRYAKHSWTNSVLILSQKKNMIEATDNAILWKTGHDIIWADTVIENMVNNGYYVNFKWNSKDYQAADDQLLWHQLISRINYKRE